jgi:TRAP-type mannitol/chloroaromatic compound transport system permease small subunit
LHRNEHIRIDVISSKLPKRVQVWIDIFGFTIFLLPISLIILYYAVPYVAGSIQNQELSSNAGGLIVWPAKLLIPVGFLMLTLQAFSELIKRIGYLMGKVDASEFERHTATPEEEIEAIKAANKIN